MTPLPPSPDEDAGLFAPEQASAVGGGMVALAAPNLIGNLLGAGRSVSFSLNRAGGAARIFDTGAVGLTNPKVGDNNSPLPLDRIGLRYNYFNDALSVTGVSSAPATFRPEFGDFRKSTETREYDVHQYTLQIEKTFFDRAASLELRIPIKKTLSSSLDLQTGERGSIGMQPVGNQFAARQDFRRRLREEGVVVPDLSPDEMIRVLQVNETSGRTLGEERTELGNLSFIYKHVLHRNETLTFSGGAAVSVPTAPDTRVRVVDFGAPLVFDTIEWQRVREFNIKNETWGLSPFLAALYTPGPRFFAQGFLQVDVPLNSSSVTFSERIPILLNENAFRENNVNVRMPPFEVSRAIEEQTLAHLDLGAGFWLVRNPCARFVNGWIPTAELHFTSSLTDADLVVLPRDSTPVTVTTGTDAAGQLQVAQVRAEERPTVGNRQNRVDIVDLTVGSTLVLANRATLAAAFSVPLRGQDDRTFDWEFHVQLNVFFGGPLDLTGGGFAPPF